MALAPRERWGAIAFSELEGTGAMTEPDRPVVVLVERRTSDDDVMREARARTAALDASLVLAGPHRVDRLVVGGEDVVRGGALVRGDEAEIGRASCRERVSVVV